MRPIPQHDNFHRSAILLKRLAQLGCQLDLPDKVTFASNRPILMAANHRSFLDLPISMAMVDRFGLSARFLVRADLMESGPGAKLLHGIGCIPADRETRHEAETTAIDTLKAGQLVGVMPEGRLVKPSEWVDGVGEARPGVSRIACGADAVVLPIAFKGTEKVWPRGSAPKVAIPRPRVTVRTGPLISFSSDDHQDNADQVMAAIAKLLLEM